MENQNHCMSIKQAKLIVNAHKHNLLKSFCSNGYFCVNMKTTEHLSKIKTDKQTERQTDRQNALFYASNWLDLSFHSQTTGWAMKSRTALTINMFLLFDIFGSPCRRGCNI